MVVETTIAEPAAAASPSPAAVPPIRDKIRFRFRKDGALRWLSHHDLMRTVERMLRRAVLPIRSTEGFHKHPRMTFALAMPLGVIGCEEVLELELEQLLAVEEIHERLSRQCPPGLTLLSIRRIDPKAGAQVRRLAYRCRVPAERCPNIQEKIMGALALSEWWVERKKPAPPRRMNIRPFISELTLTPLSSDQDSAAGEQSLEMTLWLRPEGTGRPEEILQLLGVGDLLPQGLVLERSRLELHDEVFTPSSLVSSQEGSASSDPPDQSFLTQDQ
jgi:radical SAM-linked protein